MEPTCSPGSSTARGRRVYVDVPIFEGTYEFGEDVRASTGTKDALLVAIDV
jgi:hypothetical protein